MMEEEINYPYIVFKIEDSYYCVNSNYISTIVQLPHYDKIPAAPANVTGMFRYRDKVIQMLDLRVTFGYQSLAEECRNFEEMIDARKQDHINWVNELERTIETGQPFMLAKNPHECALGRWYDQFISENNLVAFHLHKIEEPHERLHHAAEEVERCEQQCDGCRREECLKDIFNRVKGEYMPEILRLLDETKNIFRSSMYREMVLLLDGSKWGIVVDEIVAVEPLNVIEQRKEHMVGKTSFIAKVLEREKEDGLIFELNMDALTGKLKEYEQVF